ncbi:MAG: CBS domain-containing protein [Deltaproteobacteria bacterium]|nr:MAG: CBS domain-containing protein [Deltaproteobacteria bacterium]
MRVADLMTSDLITIAPGATVADALDRMYTHDVRHLPVVRHGRLVGMLSDRDMRGLFIPDPEVPGLFDASRMTITVSDLMSNNPIALPTEADVDDAIEAILENHIGAIPIVDALDGTLVGIVSYTDILREAQGRL